MFLVTFKGDSRELQVYLKEVQRVFQESFKGILRKFQGCLKNVSSAFQGNVLLFCNFVVHGNHRSYLSRRRACLKMSYQPLEFFWRVDGGCVEGIRKVSEGVLKLSQRCLRPVLTMSHRCLEGFSKELPSRSRPFYLNS